MIFLCTKKKTSPTWGPAGRTRSRVRVPYEVREGVLEVWVASKVPMLFFSWPSKTTTIKWDRFYLPNGSFEFGMLWNNGVLFDFEILILTLKSSSPYFYIDLMIAFGNRIFFFFSEVPYPQTFWRNLADLEPCTLNHRSVGGERVAGCHTASHGVGDWERCASCALWDWWRGELKKTWNFGEIWSVGILGKADLLTWIRRRFFFDNFTDDETFAH